MSEPHNVLLVHGGFVDGSGWAAVYHLLKRGGFNVSVVQNPTLSLEGDAAATRQILDQEDGPVMLVGHSYGGAVISEAGTHDSVAGLVYVCAFAPDQGESVSSLLAGLPPDGPVPPILPPQDGFLFLDREKFAAAFAADVPTREGPFMADSQVPWGVEALNGTVSDPAWRSKPSWYLNTTEDRMIPPALQRTMAERTGATTTQVNDNHGWYKLHGQFFTADFPTTSAANPPVDQLLGVNDKDQAVGFFTDATAINHGYEFDISSGRYKEITVSGFSNITTSGINNHGDIVGFGTASDGNTHGFLLTNGGSRVAELSYPGAASTQPLGVNSNDEVVGVATVGSGSSAKMLGFTYYPGYGFRTINDPHGNGTTTINGVNACGDLVGFYVDGAGNTDGLLANAQFSPTASSTMPAPRGRPRKARRRRSRRSCPRAADTSVWSPVGLIDPRTGGGFRPPAPLRVLSHQTRHARLSAAQRRLTGRFTQDSVAAVGEATAGFGVSKPAISKHLRVLEDSGVVRRVVEGRTHRLSLEPDVLSVAADWMDRQRALWGRLFDVVDEYLKEEAPQ